MQEPLSTSRKVPILVELAALVIIIAGMRAANAMIVRFLLAMLIAFICGPIFFRLNRLGLPQWVSLIAVLVIIGLVGLGLATLIGASINDLSASLPIYQENLQNMMINIIDFLAGFGIEIEKKTLLNIFDPSLLMSVVGNLLSTLTSMLSDSVLITFYVVFMLLEAYSVPLKVKAIWGENSRILDEINRFVKGMQHYISLKTIISLATGIFIGIALLIIGIDFALLWAVVAFLLNFIPTIGSIVSAIPPILLSLFLNSWVETVAVIAVYLTVNNVIGGIIEPRVMGKGLDLSTLMVFISLIFWGWVLGPIGMLLSVPLTMGVKMALELRAETRWIAHLIAGEPHAQRKPKHKVKRDAESESTE